jgi:predicted phage terminase large subunit-like protein
LSEKWPKAHAKLIEDKANGPAVIAMLRHEVDGLIAVNPEGGKEARANAVSPQIEAGNVYLPEVSTAPWIDAFIEECAVFPNGPHDDQVDAMTQALLRLKTRILEIPPIISITRVSSWRI